MHACNDDEDDNSETDNVDDDNDKSGSSADCGSGDVLFWQ